MATTTAGTRNPCLTERPGSGAHVVKRKLASTKAAATLTGQSLLSSDKGRHAPPGSGGRATKAERTIFHAATAGQSAAT